VMDEEPLLVDVKEAARLLSISTALLYDMVADGTIPHVRLGRRVLFSLEGLRRWIADGARP
jgi:excisionase family DNA binding protein